MHGRQTEEYPRKIYYQECDDNSYHRNPFARSFADVEEAFETLHDAVNGAPYNECEVGPMPYTADKECGEDIAVGTCIAFAVAAERDVDVVAEPTRERYVPALPELCEAAAEIRAVEVVY